MTTKAHDAFSKEEVSLSLLFESVYPIRNLFKKQDGIALFIYITMKFHCFIRDAVPDDSCTAEISSVLSQAYDTKNANFFF